MAFKYLGPAPVAYEPKPVEQGCGHSEHTFDGTQPPGRYSHECPGCVQNQGTVEIIINNPGYRPALDVVAS